jgi:hypothetical protein
MGLSSCDEGKIYDEVSATPEEGLTLMFSGAVTGTESWPEGYTVSVAGFGDTEYALISKPVVSAADGGVVEVTLSGISDEVKTVELCVLNRLRRKMVTFASTAAVAGSDGVVNLTTGAVDATMYGVIQKYVFDASCVQCHGGSSYSAAGLNLTDGKSHAMLVGVASKKVPSLKRVSAGDGANSVLWQVVGTDLTSDWAYHHNEILTSPTADMIKSWIDSGAN